MNTICHGPKFRTGWFYKSVMRPEDAAGMANGADPDQSDLAMHCLPSPLCPDTYGKYYFPLVHMFSKLVAAARTSAINLFENNHKLSGG